MADTTLTLLHRLQVALIGLVAVGLMSGGQRQGVAVAGRPRSPRAS